MVTIKLKENDVTSMRLEEMVKVKVSGLVSFTATVELS